MPADNRDSGGATSPKNKETHMKTNVARNKTPKNLPPSEVREYAYHLYVQSGRIPGRDLDNWLDAEATLKASLTPLVNQRKISRDLS